MRSFNILAEPDEIPSIHFELGRDKYSVTPFSSIPVISYKYLNIKQIQEYCFNHAKFSQDYYYRYFQRIKEICRKSIEDLNNIQHQGQGFIGFRISSANSTLKDLLSNLAGRKLTSEEIPEVGHFHLTDNPKSDGSERPVIHFFIGDKGVFYILFFDTLHSIHPTDH